MFLSIAGLFFIPSRRLCLSSCYLAFVGSQDGAMATNDSGRDILGICGAGNGKRWRFRQKWTGGQTVARLLRSLQRRLHQPFLFCVFSPCSWITKREGWITRGFCGVCLFWMMLESHCKEDTPTLAFVAFASFAPWLQKIWVSDSGGLLRTCDQPVSCNKLADWRSRSMMVVVGVLWKGPFQLFTQRLTSIVVGTGPV